VMACRACRQRIANSIDDFHDDEMKVHAETYEQWAVHMLNAIDKQQEAKLLLEHVPSKALSRSMSNSNVAAEPSVPLPAIKSTRGRSGAFPTLERTRCHLWNHSILDEACMSDSALACFHVLEHRHVQFVLSEYYHRSHTGRTIVYLPKKASTARVLVYIMSFGLGRGLVKTQEAPRSLDDAFKSHHLADGRDALDEDGSEDEFDPGALALTPLCPSP
jgi:hypothetical protein